MMDAQLRDIHERGEPIAALWASEETIYGRFGYGIAAWAGEIKLGARVGGVRAAARAARRRCGSSTPEEAAKLFPPVWDALMAERPGVFQRTKEWWELRRAADAGRGEGEPEALRRARARRRGAGLRDLPAVPVVGGRRRRRRGSRCRGDRRDAGGDGGDLALRARHRLVRDARGVAAAARPSVVPAARDAAADEVPGGRLALGAARRRRRRAVGPRVRGRRAASSSTCATPCARGTRAAGSSRAARRRARRSRRRSRSTWTRSGRRISVRVVVRASCGAALRVEELADGAVAAGGRAASRGGRCPGAPRSSELPCRAWGGYCGLSPPESLRLRCAAPAAAHTDGGAGLSLEWPASGTITRGFGYDGRPSGIPASTSARSARSTSPPPRRASSRRSATCRTTRATARSSLVDLGDGLEALYAHLSWVAREPGRRAWSTGQKLGIAGCTGYCTGTHLHFELRERRRGLRSRPAAARYYPVDQRAVSSVGRAPARQAGGHWFEPSTAHSERSRKRATLARGYRLRRRSNRRRLRSSPKVGSTSN